MQCAPTVIGSCVKPIRAEVPRALSYPAFPPLSQRTGIQAVAPTTRRPQRRIREDRLHSETPPPLRPPPNAVATFIPPFTCATAMLLFLFHSWAVQHHSSRIKDGKLEFRLIFFWNRWFDSRLTHVDFDRSALFLFVGGEQIITGRRRSTLRTNSLHSQKQ